MEQIVKRLKNIGIHAILANAFAVFGFLVTGDIWEAIFVGILGVFIVELTEGRDWFWWGRVVEWATVELEPKSIRGREALIGALNYALGRSEKGSDPLWDWAGPAGVLILEGLLFRALAKGIGL